MLSKIQIGGHNPTGECDNSNNYRDDELRLMSHEKENPPFKYSYLVMQITNNHQSGRNAPRGLLLLLSQKWARKCTLSFINVANQA